MKMETKEGVLECQPDYTPIRFVIDPEEPHMTIIVRDGGFEVAYGDHVLSLKKGQLHFLTGDPDD